MNTEFESNIEKASAFLKEVLNESFPDFRGKINMNEDWHRVSIGKRNFQFGIEEYQDYVKLKMIMCLDEINHDIEYIKFQEELKKFNRENMEHMLRETDNFFHIDSFIHLKKRDDREKIRLVRKINELFESSEDAGIIAFIGKFKNW
ncbi:MAG: hypothetical protein N4A49_02015 [Marinifilaceae bacterium]|jgi:hypothetical protein|nr:hypothetical protein [Marinifilaceae bacterium]